MKKILKVFMWGFVGLIGFSVIAAVFGGESKPEAQPTAIEVSQDSEAEVKTDEKPKEEEKTEFAIDEVIKLKDNILTVTEVTKSSGDEYDKPKKGMEYVIVSVKIQNGGEDVISYNPFDFKMSNSKGQIVDSGFITVDSDTSLSSGELAAGGEVSGTIAFEQPKDDPKLQLIYEPNVWSDKKIIVNLNE